MLPYSQKNRKHVENIFVGFHERKPFNCHQMPLVYFRYIDDTLAVFQVESGCYIFLAKLNSLHQPLKFTFLERTQHLLDNPECAQAYSENCFRIIDRVRSTFHLAILELVYIKTRDPLLCRQKKFVFAIGLLK